MILIRPVNMLRIALLILIVTALSACGDAFVRVQPYEREYLSRDSMKFAPNEARAAFEEHIFSIREASQGGTTSLSGGCGCR